MSFNPFLGMEKGGSGGSSDTIRYTIVEATEDGKKVYRLQQSINESVSYAGEKIGFSAEDITFDSSWASDIQGALEYLYTAETPYVLPAATTNTLGGIKVGNTLGISSDGTLNIDKTQLKSIDKVEFTSSSIGSTAGIAGATDTYTIFYTDGTTSTYVIKNGTNGKDGKDGTNGKDGTDGADGITPILRASDTAIEVSIDGGESYTVLIQIADITGPRGENGKNVELQVTSTSIQWRIEGESSWTDLVQLSTLRGEKGDTGAGIESIEFTSSTGGDTAGIAGATDTYTITLTDGNTSTFIVYNGNNGDDHTHENKEVLDKLSEHNGVLEYDNDAVSKIWHGTKAEYDAIPEKNNEWTYIITDDYSDSSDAKRAIVDFSTSASQNAKGSNGYIEIAGNTMAMFCCDIEATAEATELVLIVNNEKFHPKKGFYSIMISYISDGGNGYSYYPVRVYYDSSGYLHCFKLDSTNFKVGEKLYYNAAYVLATAYTE